MKVFTILTIAVVSYGICTVRCAAQESPRVATNTQRPAAEAAPKFQFILFWKENNPPTQAFATALDAATSKYAGRAVIASVNIADEANRAIVDRYQVSRAPMPLVLCVAPNGAITGSMARIVDVTETSVERLVVTPAMADVTKALQDKKIAVVHITADARSPLPQGAAQFVADPMFSTRTQVVTLTLGDPAEARFLKDLAVNPTEGADSIVVLFAPPGVAVGKFPAATTVDQYATALHAAGKCCNDPNCKYNKQGK